MSPNDGTGRPVRHNHHTKLAFQLEGGGLKEHPPEQQPLNGTTTPRLPRKRPFDSPKTQQHSLANNPTSRKPKSPRGVSPSSHFTACSTNSAPPPTNGSINGITSMLHQRASKLTLPRNGVSVSISVTAASNRQQRANGVVSNGHITPETLKHVIDAKLAASLDSNGITNASSPKINGHKLLNGLNGGIRVPDLRNRLPLESNKQSTNGINNGRVNGLIDRKRDKLADELPLVANDLSSRSAVVNGKPDPSKSDESPVMDDRPLGSAPRDKDASLSESRLIIPDSTTRQQGSDLRHSPRNGLNHAANIYFNNNSKSSVNNNNSTSGFVQQQFLINQSISNLPNVRRPSDLGLVNSSRGPSLRQINGGNNSSSTNSSSSLPNRSSSTNNHNNNNVVNSNASRQYSISCSSSATSSSSRMSSHPNATPISSSCSISSPSTPAISSSSSVSSLEKHSGTCSRPLVIPSVSRPGGSANSSSGPSLALTLGTSSSSTGVVPSSTSKSSLPGASTNISSSCTTKTGAVVRFPAAPVKKDLPEVCKWKECNKVIDPSTSLLEHIQVCSISSS